MKEKELSQILNTIYPLTDQAISDISSIVNFANVEKGENFVKLNARNNLEYILMDGVCRSYIIDYDGNEATLCFFISGNAFPPNQIRTVKQKSLYNMEAITKSTIAYFNSEQFIQIMHKHKEAENWGRSVFDVELKNKVLKELNLITLPAKDRLKNFRAEYPMLENLIPHSYIASYLGISPVSLSRLRGQK